ncbi:MAG: hypothetical protein GEU99_20425 [Luteitalea sp.]|nr:hypothetical protein [Luteitalea sp.]
MVASDWEGTLMYFNPDAFARVPIATASGAAIRPGTLGWNAVRGRGSSSLDLGLARNFRFGSYSLQARVDLFNALNTRNWGNPTTNINSEDFGLITSVSTRTMQVGVRFSF